MKSAAKTSTTTEPSTSKFPYVFATSTEVQQNFSKYTKIATSGRDVIVQKNGKPIAFISDFHKRPPLLTDLVGILSDQPHMSTKDVYEERRRHYEATGRL